ncbi:hypothetical protein B0O80DRAFT_486908 [Mortierella sp. GBAus27b]|nr:hypothetical protein B0O80DRAFT_486908 [Mortierella sp. GBAus27b]
MAHETTRVQTCFSRIYQTRLRATARSRRFSKPIELALYHKPDVKSWTRIYQDNIRDLLNGTNTITKALRQSLNPKERVRVRDLTRNLDKLDRYLLDIGVLTLDEKAETASFTSGIILRVCIDTLWPQPKNRLSREEIGDAIDILKLGLQCHDRWSFCHRKRSKR